MLLAPVFGHCRLKPLATAAETAAAVAAAAASGEVAVELAVGGVALKELAFDEGLDALLDDGGVGQEARAELAGHLAHNAVVVQHSPRLHDPHHRRLYLRLPVLLHLQRHNTAPIQDLKISLAFLKEFSCCLIVHRCKLRVSTHRSHEQATSKLVYFGYSPTEADLLHEQALHQMRTVTMSDVVHKTPTDGQRCGRNPWETTPGLSPTLEWMVGSPPAFHTFEEIPAIKD